MTETPTAAYEQIERDLTTIDRLLFGSRVAGIASAILCVAMLVIGLMMVGDLWPPKTQIPPTASSI